MLSHPTASLFETQAARIWLRKRGVEVATPTPLLAVRLGTRQLRQPSGHKQRQFRYWIAGVLLSTGLFSLLFALRIPEEQMVTGHTGTVIICAIQLAEWATRRARDREAAARLPHRVASVSQSRLAPLDGWYVASTTVAFGGGIALATTMFVATPQYGHYAWTWLLLLGVAGAVAAFLVVSILRAPTLADDTTSLAIDTRLRRSDLYDLCPAVCVLIPLTDFLQRDQPAPYTWPMAGHAALAMGLFAIGWLRQRHRPLPAGHYGT
ncbi:hypothetical protein [Amycolatopsis suaedae]|uniref:Uncharacterized protein n=1 Tax=Amycolatopsis suaedae TaxID=2510978 RepID=A0A4V2EMP5_9PSEU|nr:hypothetical protein [Amycolatopsis suaedae]RZQ65825.1 hypothetical protein EWH70_01720 [Amycolatopsis suaedae]